MLTEHEVSKSWRQLFTQTQVEDDTLTKAEALIDELRPESPLRHRLSSELNELRRMRKGPTKVVKPARAKSAKAVKPVKA